MNMKHLVESGLLQTWKVQLLGVHGHILPPGHCTNAPTARRAAQRIIEELRVQIPQEDHPLFCLHSCIKVCNLLQYAYSEPVAYINQLNVANHT